MPVSTRHAIVAIIVLSVVINAFLFWLIYFHTGGADPQEGRFAWIPAMNAGFNALSAIFVVSGLVFIHSGRRREHGLMMLCATVASAAFLAGYIVYHSLHGDTPFLAGGWIRPVYFTILITHIVFSILVVPLVLSTLLCAATRRWQQHRAIARWTYPVWLYVSVTGVLVFLFLRLFNVDAGA